MSTAETTAWVASPNSNPHAVIRLLGLPYAGGGASIFRTWMGNLPSTIEVCPVQLPGRETRIGQPLFNRLLPLAAATGEALVPYLDKPFAFFGHSMGALLGFELARYLRRQHGIKPIHLFVSGRSAPQVPRLDPPIHTLPEAEFIERLRGFNGIPKKVLEHDELMQLMLPVLRADLTACETYVYTSEPPLDCPISAFGGLQDPEVSRDDLLAWQYQTTAQFSMHMLAGDHFFLQTSQLLLLWILAEKLSWHARVLKWRA